MLRYSSIVPKRKQLKTKRALGKRHTQSQEKEKLELGLSNGFNNNLFL